MTRRQRFRSAMVQLGRPSVGPLIALLVVLASLAPSRTPAAAQAAGAPGGAPGTVTWPAGKRAAIVLTYDDGLASHLDVAVPQLDSAGLKGTFFLTPGFTHAQLDRWRAVARAGHELGNHSLYHPCAASAFPAEPEYTVERYRVATMMREIAMMNRLLYAIDGRGSRSYAYPCSASRVSDGDYTDSLRRSGLATYARGGGTLQTAVVANPARVDRLQVPAAGFADDPGHAALIAFVERVRAARGMGVIIFHGVGGDYLTVSARTHRALLAHLKGAGDVWVGTFQEVMDWTARGAGAGAARR